MDEKTFVDLTDAATAGLKDDPELRLAVKSELLDHLEEAAHTLAAEGHSEEESRELAMHAFGSPLEVSGKLLKANQGRMKLRALLRLAIRALLVPAAVLLALYLGWGTLAQTQQELGFVKLCFRDYNDFPRNRGMQIAGALGEMPKLPSPPLQQSLLPSALGMESRDIEFFYTSWRNCPTNKVYFANYAVYAAGGWIPRSSGKNMLSDDEFIDLMHIGERIDPENALYHYLICSRLLNLAGIEQYDKDSPNQSRYEIKDRKLLERAMQEYQAGLRKPYCKAYHLEQLNERIHPLPPDARLNDQMFRFVDTASILFPEYSKMRYVARTVAYYHRLLRQEGRMAEADALLAGRITCAQQLAQGDETLIGQLVARALYKILASEAANDYAQAGQTEKAQLLHRQLDAMQALTGNTPSAQLFAHPTPGLLTLFLPTTSSRYIHAGDLLPTMQVEHTVLEEAALGVLLLVLLVVMLCYGIIALARWLILWQRGELPLLLLPGGKALVEILLHGLLAPVCIYAIIVHWLHPAWRTVSVTQTGGYTLLAMVALVLVLAILPAVMAQRYIRRRCFQLGMLPMRGKLGKRQSAWYAATLTQSLLPIFAAITIFLGGVLFPFLAGQEQRWIKQDKILFWQEGTIHALTPLEGQVISDLRAGILRVLDEDARGMADGRK